MLLAAFVTELAAASQPGVTVPRKTWKATSVPTLPILAIGWIMAGAQLWPIRHGFEHDCAGSASFFFGHFFSRLPVMVLLDTQITQRFHALMESFLNCWKSLKPSIKLWDGI